MPPSAVLEWQRAALEQTRRTTERMMDFQQDVLHAWLGSWRSQEEVQQHGIEAARSMTNASLALVASAQPGDRSTATMDEFRAAVDDQFAELAERHHELVDSLETVAEGNVDAYDELSDELVDAYGDQWDAAIELTTTAGGDPEGSTTD